jgi:mRNA interferase MazF
VLVVQANAFNRSRIATVVAAVITSNVRLGALPGNVLLLPRESGLGRPSVVNVSQIIAADRAFLRARAGRLRPEVLARVDRGLELVLGLGPG